MPSYAPDPTLGASRRQRVGLVAPLPPQIGGVASFAGWLLEREDELGVRFAPFDLSRPLGDEMGGRLRLSSIPRQLRLLVRFVRWLPGSPRLVHYCVACSLTGLARDLVFLALLRLARRTTIAHVHGAEIVGSKQSRLRSIGLRSLPRVSSVCVAVAPTCARILERFGVPARSIVNPIRLEPNGLPLRRPGAGCRLLFVGTYGDRKGGVELIRALASARSRGADVTLRFVGKEERRGEEAGLRREVSAHALTDAVEFTGLVGPDRLRAMYGEADAICLPSKSELLPMSLLEAMAFGLPALTTPVGAITDLVEDGTTGFLVEPGDVEGLAAAILALAHDPERVRSMGEAARERAYALASPTMVTARWRSLYAECG